MRIGDPITFIDTKGNEHGATVTGVPDTGPSGKKILNLEYRDARQIAVVVEGVVHGDDRESGKSYWQLVTESDDPPDRRAELKEQPIALAKAEASGALPPATRREEDAAPLPKRRKSKA